MNQCEAEIDAIRLKLYEETKDMTKEEQDKRLNERVQRLAAQFGFTIIPSPDEKAAKLDVS